MIVAAAAVVLLLALLAPRYVDDNAFGARIDTLERFLRKFGPWIAAVVSLLVVWYVWDAVVPLPKVHDENSYLLQAQIFARGRWTAPSPPIPDFFEQPHVLVVPVVASKYPPGHALLLSIGAFVGFVPLVPLLLTAISAALIFALATRLTNPWIALLTWVIWLSAPIVLRFQPSYFSELTTSVAVLGSWWALLDWRATRRKRWLLVMALAIGWGAITRPLTMLAFAIPIGFVVVRDVIRLRLWTDIALAFAVGCVVLGILPLWSAKTTGDWRVTPLTVYRRDYMPYDVMGFTTDTTPPRRAVSPVLKTTNDYFTVARKQQRLGTVPRIAYDRFVQLTIAFFQGSRLLLLPFAVVGLFFMNGALLFGAVSALVLLLAHLPYGHWAPWTLYYLEGTPVIAAITALGLWQALLRATRVERRAKLGVVFVTAVLMVFAVPILVQWRRDHRTRARLDNHFAAELKKLPPHSIVFIRYSPRVVQHMAVVFNYPDLNEVSVWVVHDLGPRNAELRRLAPDRASFDFEEDQLVQRSRR